MKYAIVHWFTENGAEACDVEFADTMEQAAELHLENATYNCRSQVFSSSLDPSFWNANKGWALQRYIDLLTNESDYTAEGIEQIVKECKKCLIN